MSFCGLPRRFEASTRNAWLRGGACAGLPLGLLAAPLLICLQVLTAPALLAQTASQIQGTVTDQQGLPILGATILVLDPALAIDAKVTTDAQGTYRLVGLPAGTYTLRATQNGFTTKVYSNLVLTVNRTLLLDITLTVGNVQQQMTVRDEPPWLDTSTSSTGSTILPEQIESMPTNGRNYLDLIQLVPGVAINRNARGDDSAPVLGDRAGNAVFLIDGQPNRDEVNGGPAAEFNQDTILEFQVLTSGYKAEFGHGSGGVVNVVTRSGSDPWHGTASSFHRNYLLDSSNVPHTESPFLLRWDISAALGGPILKDRVFFFGAAERIRESRESNFQFPPETPESLLEEEQRFNQHSQTYETRAFAKLDEQWSHHRLSQQMNLTNAHLTDVEPDFQPSSRGSRDLRRLMLGFRDTATLGDQSTPYLLNAYVQYRSEPSVQRPAHPEASLPFFFVNLFSSPATGQLFGDVAQVFFGPGYTPLVLEQKYLSTGVNLAKQIGRHGVKFGWDLQHTRVEGTEAVNIFEFLTATASDFDQFGLQNSGVYLLFRQGGETPEDNHIRLRNLYDGLFFQDDWKALSNLTLNLGLRWDYDSEFPNRANFSPRLGFAWSIGPKTVLSASWGVFYDHFRTGLARDIPGFGGADITATQAISFPRLFYGDPSILPVLGGLCLSPDLTDAQILALGATCPFASLSFFGVDHLNSVVAPGHAPVPANAVLTMENVEALTGLSAQQFLAAASAAVGQPPGFFYWGDLGNLSVAFLGVPAFKVPITVDPGFRTPSTRAFHVGLQRELTSNLVMYADFFHKDMRNILGVRITNLAFEARLPDHTGETLPGTGNQPINSYGPWYRGSYDGVIVGFRKRMSRGFTLEGNYAFAHEEDNLLNSNFVSDLQTGLGVRLTVENGPTDSFVGIPPVVTDAGQSNMTGPFVASNGNPVPQAGKFYNGPDLDRGPSDLARTHTLLLDGLVQLPWQFEVSAIFRTQSGFHYNRSFLADAPDVDGDAIPNFVDFRAGRNHFTAPWDVNLDFRLSKRLALGERAKLQTLIEFFNFFNRRNPTQVQQTLGGSSPFGTVTQVLPGREGQLGLRIEF